jgi:hypothetical protein
MARTTLVTPCAMCRKRSAMTGRAYCDHKSCFKKFGLGTERDQEWITAAHFDLKLNHEIRVWSAQKTRLAHQEVSNKFTEMLRRYVDEKYKNEDAKYLNPVSEENEGIQMEYEEVAAP